MTAPSGKRMRARAGSRTSTVAIAAMTLLLGESAGMVRDMTFRPVVVAGERGFSATGRTTSSTPRLFLGAGPGRSAKVFLDSPGVVYATRRPAHP